MPTVTPDVQALVATVTATDKYAAIHPALVRRLVISELAKGRNSKEVVKAVRSKLHQIGGAYQEEPIGYTHAMGILSSLTTNISAPELRDYCRSMLAQHASTRERLPILENFYQILNPIAPIHSVLDLACGLNPLALPWMPLAEGAQYYACDIYADMLDFIRAFYNHIHHPMQAFLCDLTSEIPSQPVQLALLLKTIPCLEQVDKSIGQRLLNNIHAEYILVTFPARSLGGHAKGMPQTYEAHFTELLFESQWQIIQQTLYSNELAFLLKHA